MNNNKKQNKKRPQCEPPEPNIMGINESISYPFYETCSRKRVLHKGRTFICIIFSLLLIDLEGETIPTVVAK